MTPELKAKWCANLRSGNFSQAREKLATCDGGMCCLGVGLVTALNLSDRMEVYEEHDVGDGYPINLTDGDELSTAGLKVLGIDDKAQTTLIRMNDGDRRWDYDVGKYVLIEHCTFAQIADWIEKNL